MTFPSGGCSTCKARHIKCDEQRPFCTQCQRSGRECIGLEETAGSFLFRNENPYASNQLRRPRGGARFSLNRKHKVTTARSANSDPGTSASSNAEVDVSIQGNSLIKSALGKHSPGVSPTYKAATKFRNIHRTSHIPSTLSLELEDLALSSFSAQYFRGIQQAHPGNIWIYIHEHCFQPRIDPTPTNLELVATAIALAIFSRKYRVEAAFNESRKRYSEALIQVRKSMSVGQVALTDELLVTIMALASYEDKACNFDQSSLFVGSWRHHDGASALLQLRQAQRKPGEEATAIDQLIRQQIIRSAIYRALEIPLWIQDGSQFGEKGIELELDKLVVEVAQIRHRRHILLESFKHLKPDQIAQYELDTRQLVTDCFEVDTALSAWRSHVPQEYWYTIRCIPSARTNPDLTTNKESLFYSSEVQIYPNAEYSASWNRYRGARLILNGIVHKILNHPAFHPSLDENYHADEITAWLVNESPRQRAQDNIQRMVNDVCASVAFHFDAIPRIHEPTRSIIKDARPHMVYQLVWPLILSASAMRLEDRQLEWIRGKIVLIGEVVGSGVYNKLATMDLQAHARLVRCSNAPLSQDGGGGGSDGNGNNNDNDGTCDGGNTPRWSSDGEEK